MRFEAGRFGQPECRLDDGRALSELVDEQNPSRGEAPAAHPQLDRLIRTIWRLRQADGCPWDREQTHRSITKNMVEEAYEANDAIEAIPGAARAQLPPPAPPAAAAGEFDNDDVAHGLNEKLVRRHPHVFGDLAAASDGQAPAGYEQAHDGNRVLDIWDDVKRLEREARGQLSDAEPGLLDSVPASLPALMQAQKISKRAAKAGFEWADLAGVWDKVAEERAEFEAEEPGTTASQEEFGDLLFALVNVARWSGVDAEEALAASNRKFRRRWARMEELARAQGRAVEDLSTVEQNELWDRAKGEEKPAE